jgi:hypothetical protein
MPATHHLPEGAKDGAFAAYGPRRVNVLRQLARPVARLLRGEDPGMLPIEQPTRSSWLSISSWRSSSGSTYRRHFSYALTR